MGSSASTITKQEQGAEGIVYEYSQPANLLAKSPRKYLLFVPKIAVNPAPRPIVFLFHGTDETCWETELFKQERDDNRAWQRLAQKENFYVVWAESTVAILSPKYSRKVWQPDRNDYQYVAWMIRDACANPSLDAPVDLSRLYAVGFSNGGLFMSDIVVLYSEIFAGCCNYMGGLDDDLPPEVMDEARMKDRPKIALAKRHVPLFIITGIRDDNRKRCHRARTAFKEEYKWKDVEFYEKDFPPAEHEFYSDMAERIWEFFKGKNLISPADISKLTYRPLK